MKIHPVAVREDNYAYILQSSVDGRAVFVDVFDVEAVSGAAEKLGIPNENVVGLLTTHHHFDHSGGNEAFAHAYPGRPIYGGSDKIPALTKLVHDADRISELLGGVSIECVATPCHTQDHICYHVTDTTTAQSGVFTGDTLFISGCGRFFEGHPQQMLSAMDRLSSLPDHTLVYCGHEYTKSNVAFSAAILPPSEHPITKLINDLKTTHSTTGMYTIADERNHNPFMRCRDQLVKDKLAHLVGHDVHDEVEVMRLLRELKNGGHVKANI
ncbi:uncharacterized protein UMAG_00589 [Mycosarcoma maydis]|uniref:hydroxyacylglutathione hydrolase n=1 Tax=Mycosarcoma maydis TaxID=5270 RepID=A0A0D1EA83_MYCMD|nr:uncharacterized protein UMAG_00589 [Ustilago maydis 521]KIS72171.1 hypothetical protein UMAG_00589 [Ustilago maydis 521]|eukprot:XP_011386414.1 hypothetical protein UMAG_00589 [Ustilago maydis 521]